MSRRHVPGGSSSGATNMSRPIRGTVHGHMTHVKTLAGSQRSSPPAQDQLTYKPRPSGARCVSKRLAGAFVVVHEPQPLYIPTRHHICYSDPLRVNRLCLCPCHASFMLRGFACLLARSWNSCALHKRERGEGERGVTCCKTSWAMASLLQLPHIFDLQHLINTLLASRLRVFVLSFFLASSCALSPSLLGRFRCNTV
ncbi:hypothetical protein GGP41_004300 [Bipolaris sorokiniana]|uniref:Uncharacterized protein n=1 Tax=Cochliobolus sativus TaxID=45130 RepID=A0A8H5ZLP2_COCSA|nr:hypothetical protein GGP41_004300 [Bipolaris sorokiniana]